MALKKKVLIVIGFSLAAVGMISAVTALFYEFKVKPEMIKRGALIPSQKLASPKSAKAVEAGLQGIGMNELTSYAKDLYSSDESVRREGSLWVDRNSKKFVVNLGALNGLKIQDYLVVYDYDQKIGRVRAVSVFDVVSYVESDGTFEVLADKDYYSVQKE